MRAGELDQRVDLEEPIEERNDSGELVTTGWRALATGIPCKILSAGSEGLRGRQVSATASHVITMRYRTDITAKHRLKWGARYLYVRSAEDRESRRRELEVVCGETADG